MAPKNRYVATIPQNIVTFVGPVFKGRTLGLVIMNTTKERVAFKIKTTTPDLFYVNIIWGFLQPGYQKEITIGIRTAKWQSLMNGKPEHSFMLLAHPADPTDETPEQFWARPKQKAKMQLKKMPVRFENNAPNGFSDKEVQADIVKEATIERVEYLQDWLHRLQDESCNLQHLLEDRLPVLSSSVVSLDSAPSADKQDNQSESALCQRDRSVELEELSAAEVCPQVTCETIEHSDGIYTARMVEIESLGSQEIEVQVHEAPVEIVRTSYAKRVHRVTDPL